jgi:DNA-binding MarR family transcriptional regulator
VVIRILQLGGHLTALGDALARPSGQSSARWQVLAAVEDEPRSVAHIARALGLARQSVQRVADLLVDEELAIYQDNPAHQRAKLLELTAHGRGTLHTIQVAQQAWADELGAELGEAKLRQAQAVLTKLLEALQARALPE